MRVLAVQEHKIVDESKEIGSEISANGSKMFFHQQPEIITMLRMVEWDFYWMLSLKKH